MLQHSRPPLALLGQDLGAIPPDTVVPGITLVFRRQFAQEAALKALLLAQQNRASTRYHQWLTPDTFAARFGTADEDIADVQAWLVSHGFHVDGIARSRDRITFSGSAAQVHEAFGTELHHFRAQGELHFAPADNLTLPAELASVTAAVLHLSDFRPRPNFKVHSGPHPDYTSFLTQAHYLTPKDIATMYDLNPLWQNGFEGGGQGLAVVGQSFVNTGEPSSVQTFQANLNQFNSISNVLVPGSGVEAVSPGDEAESELDLEYASGIAQNANIFLVYVGDSQNYSVFDALAFAIETDIAPVVSISYGVCESLLTPSDLDQNHALFEEAAAQGQTLVAAAGDSGSTGCAPDPTSSGVTPAQQQALSVIFPASSPYVTAVGGTQMAPGTFARGDSSYWAAAVNSSDTVSSLLSYVPEVVWNEGSVSNGIVAGGGGASTYSPRPAWQSGVPGIPEGAYRLLPDVALQSSIASPGFLFCTSDSVVLESEGLTASCQNGLLGSNDQYTTAGGTSFAAPIFAGFVAILNQVEGALGQGNINPVLYGLAASSTTYAAAFHDILSGSNACVAGAANCAASGQSDYGATVGYDEASGLGSVDFNALVTEWPSISGTKLIPTLLLLLSPQATASPGDTVAIPISVQPFGSMSNTSIPTGTASVSVDGILADASLPLVPANTDYPNATATYNFVAPAVIGSHVITATYFGDAAHSPSQATYSVLVGNVLASGSVALAAGNLTIVNPGKGSTQVTVTPTGGYSGRLLWSLSYAGSGPELTACYAITSLPVNNVSSTQLTIGIGTACKTPLTSDRENIRLPGQHTAMNGVRSSRSGAPAPVAYGGLLLCELIAFVRPRICHRFLLTCMSLLLVIVTLSLTGCGGGSTNTGPSTPSRITNSYIFTLTGTDSVNGAVTASTNFTLVVVE